LRLGRRASVRSEPLHTDEGTASRAFEYCMNSERRKMPTTSTASGSQKCQIAAAGANGDSYRLPRVGTNACYAGRSGHERSDYHYGGEPGAPNSGDACLQSELLPIGRAEQSDLSVLEAKQGAVDVLVIDHIVAIPVKN
jgi:hypothetical protein